LKFLKEEPFGTVKGFFLSSAAWFAFATFAGLVDATDMMAPELLQTFPFMVFGRVRPIHVNIIIFGFVGSALQGASLYLVPTLVKAPLYSERIGKISLWLWNLALVAGVITLDLGYTQAREYAELIWPIDIGVMICWVLLFYNYFQTVKRRTENILYVSVWYVLGSVIFTFFSYGFGNAVWHPSTGAITGMPDAILAWFNGHNIVGLFLTPLAIAVTYYIFPILSGRPLFSHTLSLIGFWSILLIYTHIGTHHLLQTPAPTWLKVVAITGSIGMLIPVLTVLVNQWLTMRGRLGAIHQNIGGKFVFAGTVWYLLVCLQGPLQAMPSVQRLTHLNNWVIAHSHIGVLGFAGFIALGGIYFILPRVTGRPVYSKTLADVQYWLILIGLSGFFLVLTIAGLIQGNGWLNGEPVYNLLTEIYLYMVLRASLGVLIFIGALIGLYNIYKSIYGPAAREEEI
jgi:cytochrome c oxidase cbb3-type subunit 1